MNSKGPGRRSGCALRYAGVPFACGAQPSSGAEAGRPSFRLAVTHSRWDRIFRAVLWVREVLPLSSQSC
jgi:hypothetical protein